MKYTEENVAHIIYRFAVLGQTLRDIGGRFGDTQGEVKSLLNKYGISPNDRGKYGNIQDKREVTKIDIDKYVEKNYRKLFKQPLLKYIRQL